MRRSRHKVLWGVLGLGSVVFLSMVTILFWPVGDAPAVSVASSDETSIAQGGYLADAADCVACHTAPGGAPYAGGRAFKLPFGTLYSPNITPDRETGIGEWTDGEFLRAVHDGIGRSGEQLYPAFPYTSYSRMSRADVLAVKAFLFSLSPVRNLVPDNELALPFSYRRLVRFWKILFMPDPDDDDGTPRTAEWRRGNYLVNALGHCGECHTPRNLLYGFSDEALAGETMNGWTAWNITSDERHGIGAWSTDELVSYLRTGYTPSRAVASGPMKEAIDHSSSKLSDADLQAMAVYLKSVPGVERGPSLDVTVQAKERSTALTPGADEEGDDMLGVRVFAGACASCHAWNGQGQQVEAAALDGRRSVFDVNGANVLRTILSGGAALTPHGSARMPRFEDAYSDVEIAAVTNFTLRHFGNVRGRVSAQDVAAAREE